MVSLIVPARNEAPNLPPLITRLLAVEKEIGLPCEVIIIDDDSEDDTLRIAEEIAHDNPQVRAHHKPAPHGLGRAVRAGLALARGRMGVVVMADGVDPLETAVPLFCHEILDEGCQLVLLTRYRDPEDSRSIPRSYRISHALFRFVTSGLLGIPHPDTTYAFRAFDLDFVRGLGLRSDGFEISPETTLRTWYAGGRIGEVRGRQTQRTRGQSSFVFSKVALGYGRIVLWGLAMRLRNSHLARLLRR